MGCVRSKQPEAKYQPDKTDVRPCTAHHISVSSEFCPFQGDKKLDIYLHVLSSSCRAVMMTCAAIELKYQAKIIDLFKGDHLTPEFVKMNPCHTIPLVDDNGFILWQSRAIMVYIMRKYAPESAIYPMDLEQRSSVDMWLYYDVGTLYKTISDFVYPQWLRGLAPENYQAKLVEGCLSLMDTCLQNKTYLVGETLTLADISTSSSISFLLVLEDFDLRKWRHLSVWWERIKALPYFDRVYRKFFAFRKARPPLPKAKKISRTSIEKEVISSKVSIVGSVAEELIKTDTKNAPSSSVGMSESVGSDPV